MSSEEQPANYQALILGASGLVGAQLLQELLADPHCRKVTAVVRRALPGEHEKLQQTVDTMKNLASLSSLFDVDRVFCLSRHHTQAGG